MVYGDWWSTILLIDGQWWNMIIIGRSVINPINRSSPSLYGGEIVPFHYHPMAVPNKINGQHLTSSCWNWFCLTYSSTYPYPIRRNRAQTFFYFDICSDIKTHICLAQINFITYNPTPSPSKTPKLIIGIPWNTICNPYRSLPRTSSTPWGETSGALAISPWSPGFVQQRGALPWTPRRPSSRHRWCPCFDNAAAWGDVNPGGLRVPTWMLAQTTSG